MELNDDIRVLKGVGEKTAENLNKAGIFTLMDLILYFPRTYEKVTEMEGMNPVSDEKFFLRATYVRASIPVRTRTGKKMITLTFDSENGQVRAMYFNMPYIAKNFTFGKVYNLYGRFKKTGSFYSISNPKILRDDEVMGGGSSNGKIIAKYPLKENLTENLLKKLIRQVLSGVRIRENLPSEILKEYEYPELDEALRTIHDPENDNFDKALERMKFQELFAYSLKIAMAKDLRSKNLEGIQFTMSKRLKEFKDKLPYELTGAQSRSVREILLDQKKDIPMNRLLQGDVGSGKTIVAFTALFNITENGYKGVLMAPTEILAMQHYREALKIYKDFNVRVLLLTGSTKQKEKNEIKEELRKKGPLVLIGTHAVIEEDIEIEDLGMIITDEQHRFGVGQRLKLINKGRNADVLVMSATPIPRTLALYLYSDLDLSVIDELPPGRIRIETLAFTGNSRKKAYELALNEIEKGRQVYVVCPLIEDNENLDLTSVGKLYEELKSGIFRGKTIEMLYGSMRSKEKDAVMERFVKGETKVLVATTVIEVGVNVPNASVMIIENSERFGLSQLHQLRGRVGRGQYKSYCILISENQGENSRKRINIMTSTDDGFKIAEEDLKMRGTGAIFGTNQSGDSGLVLSDFINDYSIVAKASKWASTVYNSDREDYRKIREEILSRIEKSFSYVCLN